MTCKSLLFGLLVVSLQALAAQGKDPNFRDETISATNVSVSVNRDSYGNYIYQYDVSSSDANIGRILSLNVDISCGVEPEFPAFNPGNYRSPLMDDSSKNDLHVPVVVQAPPGQAAFFGIDPDNSVSWGVVLNPGMSRQGLTIISPAPPGSRGYVLTPSFVNAGEWDYTGYDEFDDLPWIDDFTVYGITIGPACPGEPQSNEPRFAGMVMPYETEKSHLPANELLDPRTRNENISNTEIVTTVKQSNGVYIYEYIVKSSIDNFGEIQSFQLNISCSLAVPYGDFYPSDYSGSGSNSSRDGKHVPVAVLADYGAAFLWGITANNYVSWGVAAKPGEVRGKLTIISPYGPTSREYRLIPYMDNSKKWDYASYDENDPSVPWIDDFTVYGTTIGPACPVKSRHET